MSNTGIPVAKIVAVLLADGWHQIVPGSFAVGPLNFDAHDGPGVPGYRFEEAAA